MKARKLTDFIPAYKEGAAKPIEGEKPAAEPLPEMKGGEVLLNPRSGKTYRVHVVRKPKRDTGYVERLYRLENVIIGNQEWSLDELVEAGMKLNDQGEKVLIGGKMQGSEAKEL